MPYIPTLEQVQAYANYIVIVDDVLPNTGKISTLHAEGVLEKETQYVQSQFQYFGLALPTSSNQQPVKPAQDLILYRTILSLTESYFNNSERVQQWRTKVKEIDLEFRKACQFYSSQLTKTQVHSGFVPARKVKIVP